MGKVPGRKFLPTIVLLLIVFYVIKQPHAAAATFNHALAGLSNAAQSITTFVGSVSKS